MANIKQALGGTTKITDLTYWFCPTCGKTFFNKEEADYCSIECAEAYPYSRYTGIMYSSAGGYFSSIPGSSNSSLSDSSKSIVEDKIFVIPEKKKRRFDL